MDLGDALGILNVVVYWRIWLSVILTALVGWLLAVPFEWISGLQGMALPAFAFVVGYHWNETAQGESGRRKTTLTVAALAGAVCGCVWGAVSFKAPAAGAVLLLVAIAIWFCYATFIRTFFSSCQAFVVVATSFIPYSVVTFLLRNTA